MVFTSFNFIIFFPLIIFIYYLLPEKFRREFLLLASYYFYINIKPVYALLLAGITFSTFVFTNAMSNTDSEKKKKLIFIVNIIIILLPLFFFKYYDFVNTNIFSLLNSFGLTWSLPHISFILPIGISFYTFMALGYSMDVYNGEIEAEKNFTVVALFLSFFPILLSGPIERATNMFHQFKGRLLFDYNKIVKGFPLMLWGYFMKLVIADRVAILVDAIFNNTDKHTGASLLMAVLLYPIQVYADLAGYSLIAIGAANIMGINIIPNFKRPFFASSMSDFWRRWHISLISWLTDYIYTPLSYNLRKYKMRGIVIALMLTFLISGIWHGAAYTFIFWGALQGTFLSIEAITNKQKKQFVKKYRLNKKRWYLFTCCLGTYLLFAFSEIFCGPVSSISKAFFIIKKIFTNFGSTVFYDNPSTIISILTGIVCLFLAEWKMEYYKGDFSFFNNKSRVISNLSYAVIILAILMIGVFDGGQFIYFKF
jgi:alginate O-acetyltransferase complex protein AlgI